MDLYKQAQSIMTRQDLATFIQSLEQGLQQGDKEWDNRDLSSYLQALSAWIEDMDGYYINKVGEFSETPTWRNIGEMLLAATTYE